MRMESHKPTRKNRCSGKKAVTLLNLKSTILQQYNIDIDKINLIKLYKIAEPNIDDQTLAMLLKERRKKWQQSVANGTNEAFTERDKAYLAQAKQFEAILCNKKLRKELFTYYNKPSIQDISKNAKQYFDFIKATCRKIGDREFEFFLNYFPEERKNKRLIAMYLKTDFRETNGKKTDNKQDDKEKKTTRPQQPTIITNLFSESTILSIRRCELLYQSAHTNANVITHLQTMRHSFYTACGLTENSGWEDAGRFVRDMRTKSFSIRNEFGADFIPVVDMYNTLVELFDQNDVKNNFEEFKLLIQYPALTPYMFISEEIRKNQLIKLYEIAKNEYKFFSLNDFLQLYFNRIYDNFGIYENSIKTIMRKADNQSELRKFAKSTHNKIQTYTASLSKNTTLIFILTYWPIIAASWIFKILKFFIEHLRYVAVISAISLSLLLMQNSMSLYKYENPLYFIASNGSVAFVESMMKTNLTNAPFEHLFWDSVFAYIFAFIIYILPGVLVGSVLWKAAMGIRKAIDLKGINRSFDNMVGNAKLHISEQERLAPGQLLRTHLPTILTNVIVVIGIITAVLVAPHIEISF